MYWPIGPPKAYGLSKRRTPSRTRTSNDGVESVGKDFDDASSVTDSLERTSVSDSNSGQSSQQQDGSPVFRADSHGQDEPMLAAKVSRGGSVFATITASSLTIWQTKPVVALASVIRSPQSMKSYGRSTALLLRPDALVIVVQTELGYLITYSLSTDPTARVYVVQLSNASRHMRRGSEDGYGAFRRQSSTGVDVGPGEGEGIKELNLRFRMVIRIDAGINKALALDDELVVATQKPAALQCIRWSAENGQSQTSTELLSRIPWVVNKTNIIEMVHDRPMNLAAWLANDGRAYAVQRKSNHQSQAETHATFQGFCFREPASEGDFATKAAINARFSLIAVGCANGNIDVYVVKDYVGNIPLSHKHTLPISSGSTGKLTVLSYSPDGYCLFAGYEKGWAIWSVYGKPGASSFATNREFSTATGEHWLQGVRDSFWVGGGCELALLDAVGESIWIVDMARSAVTGCYSSANVARGLLVSSTNIVLYSGHDITDLTSLRSDTNLWQTVQIPLLYLVNQWPIKSAVVSGDGKYVAVAGRRGLAHYSVASGRWKTFDDLARESEFAVRGGMCWHQHVLIAAVEASGKSQIRLYSRDKPLDYSHILHIEDVPAPVISTTVTGLDSLLVYTYDNTLLHYILVPSGSSYKLAQVGQIGFHGIVRAPPRVRAISWLLPEEQAEHGDPAQDVAHATVLFLVDGKLVLLQPSTNELGELKYDMRVIAHNAEYFTLMRDQPAPPTQTTTSPPNGAVLEPHLDHPLRDSLWYFDGTSIQCWPDIADVLASAPAELSRDLAPTIPIPLDFYPLSPLLPAGVLHGLEPSLLQPRFVPFSSHRLAPRSQLFLPHLLRHHIASYNSPAALHLAASYQSLPYFAHALEILLHDVLDDEVDNPPSAPESALLPGTVSFLSSFPAYLDIIVNCTRKTELRSWRTLFAHLPPVVDLFEQSLAQGRLKTAAGYLLVLHAFESESLRVGEFARVLGMAGELQEWDLCRELARFLVGIDGSGKTLKSVLNEAGLGGQTNGVNRSEQDGRVNGVNGRQASGHDDYFSLGQRLGARPADGAEPET